MKTIFLKIHDIIADHEYDSCSHTIEYWMRKEPIELSINSSNIWLIEKINRKVIIREELTDKYKNAGFLKRLFMANEKTVKITEDIEMSFIRMKDNTEYYVSEKYDDIIKLLND